MPASAEAVVLESPGSAAASASARGGKLKWHQKFAWQQFQGWRPILNVASAQILFISAGIFCIALGIPILTASLTVTKYEARYDQAGPFAGLDSGAAQELVWQNADGGVQYSVDIAVDRDMEPPIYVFYRLGSYFQNYRRYVRSYDSTQMHDGGSGAGAAACEPFQYVNFNANASLQNGGAILPCGQIAYSNFNDSYTMQLVAAGGGSAAIALDESNLAWADDQNHLYGPVEAVNYNSPDFPDFRGGATTTQPLNQAQHWMVWMRPGGSVAVTKLYAQINQKIPAGSTVRVAVSNRYNMYAFGGSKSVILTTNSWMGGRNNFLGAAYITVGGLCLLAALAFFLAYNAGLVAKRQYGDLAELTWLKKYDGSIRPAVRATPAAPNHVGEGSGSGHQKNG